MDKMTIKVSYQKKHCDNNRRVLIYKNIIGRIKIITAYTCTVSLGFFLLYRHNIMVDNNKRSNVL